MNATELIDRLIEKYVRFHIRPNPDCTWGKMFTQLNWDFVMLGTCLVWEAPKFEVYRIDPTKCIPVAETENIAAHYRLDGVGIPGQDVIVARG